MENLNLTHPPIFIGGMRRSGTTLLRKVIGSHSEIACLPTEFRFLEKFVDGTELEAERFNKILSQMLDFLATKNLRLSETDLRSRLAGYKKSWRNLFVTVLDLYRSEVGKPICGDKSPLYEFYLPQLRDWFSDIGFYFVHVLRDPLDCYASHKFHAKKLGLNNPVDWALAWNKSAAIALDNVAKYPETYFSLRYEDFVSAPESFVEKFCGMLKVIPQVERMLEMSDYTWQLTDSSTFLKGDGEIPKEYRGKIRISDSVNRKNLLSEDDTLLIRQYCGPLAVVLGYEGYKSDLYELKHKKFHRVLAASLLDELPLGDYMKDIPVKYSAYRIRKALKAHTLGDSS